MKFCNKCGAPIAPGTAPAATPTASAPTSTTPTPVSAQPTGGGSGLKIVLIVVAVIIAIGIIGIAGVGFVGYRIAKHAHVQQKGDSVKVETPLGTFSANDPDQAVKDLGVDVYPGAQVQKEGTASASFGSIHTVSANFETSDPLDKVCDFYRTKFPGATVNTSDQDHCNIVAKDKNNAITINIESSGGTTKIQIATVNKG
jgi:hypothetical protein